MKKKLGFLLLLLTLCLAFTPTQIFAGPDESSVKRLTVSGIYGP